MTFLPFNQRFVLHEGFLESDSLRRAGFASAEEHSSCFVCKPVLGEVCKLQSRQQA